MTVSQQAAHAAGSHWRRWDPHLHAPGTLFNDQFGGDWEGYLTAIERAIPAVEVLGVTDYFSIGCYRAVKRWWRNGRLSDVKLLFPNVEMRLDVATEKKRPLNLHLLFSPDDEDHEANIERVLGELSFEYKGRPYRCTSNGLQELGRAHNSSQENDDAARREGANQFKTTLDKLRTVFRGDSWIARNCIVAVSVSSNDGTSGLQADDSFTAMRREVERFAQVIFASSTNDRDFWLGRHRDWDIVSLEREYGGRKPCLHGCDAHDVPKTGAPDRQRYCWIKGDPTFESLRQAILEPEERVYIGRTPPGRYDGGMCIARVSTINTPWLTSGPVLLNPGLVAIIGPRGSGKTALADIIAIGANVTSPHGLDSSFLCRASRPVNHLVNASVELHWGDGASAIQPLCPATKISSVAAEEGIRYLSQQFVEQLCSAEGLAVELRREIERVIFDATAATDRYDADSFEQLAEIHLDPIHRQRQSFQDAIERTSAQVVAEDNLIGKLEPLTGERDSLVRRIAKTRADMMGLMPKDKEVRATRLGELEAALATAATAVDKQKRSRLRVEDLQKEVTRLRTTSLPQVISKLKNDYQDVGLSAGDWQTLSLQFTGDVDRVLALRLTAIDKMIRQMMEGDPAQPVNVELAPPTTWPYKALLKERDRVKAEVGIDAQKQQRYSSLQRALVTDERSLQRTTAQLEHVMGARDRRLAHIEGRRTLYAEVFQSYLDEKQELLRLYGPLEKVLEGAQGSLSRLRFAVSREIDLAAWVEGGEKLLDLRKESRLRGHGGIRREAERVLCPAWKHGDSKEVADAMHQFIHDLLDDFKKSMPSTVPAANPSEWFQQLASWLYGTGHIEMRYSVTYDGVAIEHLSPGTRGIVLLLLYLVIDKQDRRPLLIDQPEENLDPKSVFEELVPHFREARLRRQVVIVTHNANLVVNTDADQVIVASSEPKDGAGLPRVTYQSGSLENPEIRKAVCNILEGGEKAFMDRGRRYRLRLEVPQ